MINTTITLSRFIYTGERRKLINQYYDNNDYSSNQIDVKVTAFPVLLFCPIEWYNIPKSSETFYPAYIELILFFIIFYYQAW